MRIGIDVRYLSRGLLGGVHTYVQHVVPTLLELGGDDQFFLYADTKRQFEMSHVPANAVVRYLPWQSPLSSIQNDLFMWRRMDLDRLDVVHFPANGGFGPPGARTVITVHDAINLLPLREILRGHRKNPRTIGLMTYLHWLTTRSVRRADLIITVSDYARGEIARYSGFPLDRIIPAPHAPTPDLLRTEDPAKLAMVRKRLGVVERFVLADALKNPEVLVRAWRLLPPEIRQRRQIVFFSRQPDTLPIVREAVAAGEATVVFRPSRDDLISLYSLADAFVFPSWIEGFGIPLLEAMSRGTPIIASDRGAIPEVLGGAGLLADAEDAAAFAQHLTAVLSQPEVARRLRDSGLARVAEFSWQRTARCILESYAHVMATRDADFGGVT